MTKRSNNMVGAYLKGVSVVRAYLDDNNYLIIELSDGEQQTAGQIPACDTVLNNESLKPLTNKAVTDHFALERALTASSLAKKVDKVDGKGLSTEDFTTAFKVKLEGLENYDDTAVRSMIKAIEARLNALVGQSASDAIDTFNEIVNFLASIEDTTTLEGILAGIEQRITANQKNIATLTSRVDAEEKKNIVLIYSLAQAGLEGEAVATVQNNNYIDLLTLLYNQGTVKPAVDVYIESRSGDRHWLTDTIVGTVGNMVQLSGLILTKGWVHYVKISQGLNTQTANYQCTSENLSRTQTLYYNYEDITLAEGKTLALRGDISLSTLKQYYSPFSVIVNIFTINGVTHSFIASCSYSSADGIFIITGSYLQHSSNISRRIFISQPVDSHTATITDIYEQNIARAEDITALTDRIATASMTLRGTYTATDVDSPVVWTTPYDEVLRIAESMKRAEAGEDNNTLYYIVLDGPLGQLQAQLSYIKPWEMWMGEIPFTLAPANQHDLFIIHLSITLPEDDNQRLQANCWVGRKRLPTMDKIATRFVDTEEQMLGPQGRLQARTNIGLPVHRLWMQLDRSEGVEGVFCICKRAEGYDEENEATVAAMSAAMSAATREMFLITIFDGDTAVTGELNCIAAEQWVAEIEVSVDFETVLRWVYAIDTELVKLGEIDQGRVVFATAPSDIERAAVITGYRSLELNSTQIGTARGNLQLYTVVCDTEGNLLTAASRSAVAKLSEVQQDSSKGLDSVFIIKLVEGDAFYTVAMTLKGGYWLGATPYTRLLTDEAPLAYLLIEATIVDGVFNLTLRRPSLLTSELFETLPNGNIKVEGIGEFMAATPSGSPQHELYTSVGAKWNATTGYWEFNGINNMTNADMAKVPDMRTNLIFTNGQYAFADFRTNVWAKYIYAPIETTLANVFRNNTALEVLNLNSDYPLYEVRSKGQMAAFYGCSKLRVINGKIKLNQLTANMFGGCTMLEEVRLSALIDNISFYASPKLSKQSLLYLIQNAAPTSAITITVHADVYAWASTDAEIQEALTAQPLITLISA